MNGLAKYERIKKDAEQNKLEIARLEAEKESNDKNIGQCEENLLQVKSKASEITETVNELSKSVDRQEQIKQQMAHLQTYVEQEKELPVYEERKQKWNSSSFYGKFCSQNKRQRNKPTTQGSRLTGVIAL